MPRSKIDLAKIRAALITICPLCHQELKPPEWVRIDGERIRCAKCGGVFIEQRSSLRMT
jgi:Zn-finger nucleic acid-binding protein